MTDQPAAGFYIAPQAADFSDAGDPDRLFADWFEDAVRHEINDPDAMALATVDESGAPNVRMVLLKGFDRRGFVFYTNSESTKGVELATSPAAALCLHWKSLRRQVRMRGGVATINDEEADRYFATRSRGSRIGAWASLQSRPLADRATLEQAVESVTMRLGAGDVPRPPRWSGYRLVPLEIEFWHDRPFRLHDRLVFRRGSPDAPWTRTRLYP